MKYQIQQLIYELTIFWHGQYNADFRKITKMVYHSLQTHFIGIDSVNEQVNFDLLLLKNNYTDVYLAIRRNLIEEGK